ncbi:branched-chain amino acid ABC transporter permease [Jiella sp. MQZ9-1]|uniref:Branched-chain amino acid ABC transporter permease n=1 Tax=Jiella flava TaxID=2816857 RepID=A0A939FVR3_9HYPH|nr:branched-chain amino acid ABC transporter permease [Jiella flava]MBO0662397.1 branched-chain amino acid ABC transporter permease [Jiella flava]MCD2471621.1 branched-chain amino acid ABC transporter permease [Jiella flava]
MTSLSGSGVTASGERPATAHPHARQRSRSAIGVVIALIAVAGLCAAPFFVYPVFIMTVLCFALFATAFNLLLGYVGLLSFGHAAFFGGAAYFAAHAVKVWGFEPLSAILLAAAGAGVMGLLIGLLAIRRQGIYFAMVTLALSQMVFFIFLQAPFTHGEDGIQNVPRGHLLGLIDLNQPLNIYYFVLAIFLLGFFAVWRIVHSPFGHVLQAIRENENRAISLGYRVERYKLAAFVMSATIAGLAGAMKAIVLQIATLTDVAWQMSGEVVLMTLLGGMGTIFGPSVGAALVVTMQNYFATSNVPVTVIIGVIFVLCVLLFRRGIVGEAIRLMSRR